MNTKRLICVVVLLSVASCIQRRGTIDEEYTPIRLVGGYFPGQGLVEVAHGGQYGTVCKNGFDSNEARVLCRMLGYSTEAYMENYKWALILMRPLMKLRNFERERIVYVPINILRGVSYSSTPDAGEGPVWLTGLQCSGKEADIGECAHPGWGHVTCSDYVWLSCPITKIRLVSGPSYRAGRLEVFHGSSWGSVCSRGWDQHSANVVCRMLGLNDTTGLVYHNGYFGQGTGTIKIYNVNCTGYENDLAACRVNYGSFCSHSQDVGITCEVKRPLEGAVRLIGLTDSDGRVEIFHAGKWGSVCDMSWTDEDAAVVCQMLGFTESKSKAEKSFKREQDGFVWLEGTYCTGTEVSLLDCPIGSWTSASQSCTLAGVNCAARRNTTEIRLVGSHFNRGRLEILHNDTWGTVCDDSFYALAADVACGMLGFQRNRNGSALQSFGGGSGQIWLDDINCSGKENTLYECGHSAWGRHNCGHNEDVGVQCSPDFTSLIRLNGTSDHVGRLEVFYNGSWGTVCNQGLMGDIAAGIVCEMLGFPREGQIISPDEVGSVPIWLQDVECQGAESTLFQCDHNGWGIHSCSHSDDVGVFCGDYRYENTSSLVRLVGPSPTQGRLEVFHNGAWGSVCDDSFGDEEAALVCSMLGFGRYGRDIQGYGGGSGSIWLDDVTCSTSDDDLFQCSNAGWGVNNCGHNEDVGVNCIGVSQTLQSSSLVRLVGPSPTEGRLEVFHNGEWGSVCDDGFGSEAAAVVCSMLRFGRYGEGIQNYGGGNGSIWLDDVTCSSSDDDLFQCSNAGWGVNNCQHSEDVGVKCISRSHKAQQSPFIRIVGPSPTEGRLEVFHNSQWGSVCDDHFGNLEAALACFTLGFARSGQAKQSYGGGTGQIWLDEVSCSTSDDSFFQCGNAGWGTNDCSHSEDVGVSCVPKDLEATRIRLVGEHFNAGRVEVLHDGMWGTVCSDTFYDIEADVVCRMLGLGQVVRRNTGRPGQGRIWLSRVSCSGNETSLFDCGFKGWGQHTCSHSEDIWIECSDTVSTHNYIPSLSGGSIEGRLKLSVNGSQLEVCNDALSRTSAEKVCRILGFDTSNGLYKLVKDGRYGAVSTDPVVAGIQCTGDEKILEQCDIVTASSCPSGQTSSLGLDCLESKVRLVGVDEWMGRLEVNMNGTWGTVCSNNFDNNEANVVCRMIVRNKGLAVNGYTMTQIFAKGSSNYPIVLGYLNCNGNDVDIAECSMSYKPESDYFKSNCDHSRDAEVQCRASVSIRLTDGGNSTDGRVEVYVGGRWGSVCSLSTADARVICRMLGFWESDPIIRSGDYFSSTTLNHSIVHSNCQGSEPNLALCRWDTTSSCNTQYGAGLTCRSSLLSSSSLRLAGDILPWRGQVQLRPGNKWGYVYYYGQSNTAQPICKTFGFRWPLSTSTYGSNFHSVGVPELFHSLRCSGSEDNIGECTTTTNEFPSYGTSYSLNVDCVGSTNPVRLVNGSTPLEGRVEVLYNGVWGTVCDSGWGTSDTLVLCRSLGFQTQSTSYYYSAHYGEGTGPVHFSNMGCSGSELHIAQCSSRNGTSCVHSEDIGVRCSGCVRILNTTTGSINATSSDNGCYFIIKSNAGQLMLHAKLLNIYNFEYSQSVEIRREPTGQYYGEYHNNEHASIAGPEFWLHYVNNGYTGSQLHLSWSPLNIHDVIKVDCTHTHWNVSVNMTNLAVLPGYSSSYSDIYIGECNSPSRFNEGTYYLTPLLTDCGTQRTVSHNGVVSFKNVLADREQSGIIYTGDRWKVAVQCKLSTESSSHIDLRPVDKIPSSTVQTVITGSGRPETHVSLYTDPYYYREPVDNGSRISIGQPVYVKVTLQSPNPRDKMVVQDCYAKPGVDVGASQSYKLIDNGCPIDSSIHVDSMVDTETRFYFHMFSFRGNRPHVIVYCDTSYCDKGDNSLACLHGCRSAG